MNEKESLKAAFKELNSVMGVSGHEQEVIKAVHAMIRDHADEVHVSTTGNVVAVKKGKKPGPKVAIGAHMDEVGYIVRNILPSGYLTIDKIGSAPDSVAVGRQMWVSQKRVPGVTGTKPGHLQTAEEQKAVTPVSRLYVDLGCKNSEEVKALGIKIGDPAIIASPWMEMSNPDLICTRAVDDRIGCAIIAELFKSVDPADFAGTLYGVFTVREEIGLLGAKNALFNYDIDWCVALDTIPVADTPDYDPASVLPMFLGKGPGFPVAESVTSDMGAITMAHPGVRKFIEDSAVSAGISLQTVTVAFSAYITDAASFAYVKGGIPTATLTIPRRYSHSPVELFDINDALGLLKLLKAMMAANDKIDCDFVKI